MEAVGRRRTRLGRPRAAIAAVGAGLSLLSVALTGCGSVNSDLPDAARPLEPRPTASLAGQSSPPATPPPDCGEPTATYRPPAPGTAPTGPRLTEIVTRGYLTVGVRPDTPPLGSVDPENGQFLGFEVAMTKLVSKALLGDENKIQFRAINAAQRLPLAADGTLDMTVGSITVNCERRAVVDFTEVYYQTARGLLVLTDSPYNSLDDLGGRPVCAATATTSLKAVVDSPSKPVPYPVANTSDCMVALQDGTVEGIVSDEGLLAGLAAQDPRTHVVDVQPLVVPVAAAISQRFPDLTAFVNGVLERAFADGTWAEIYQTYLGQLRSPPPPPSPVYRN